MSADISLRPATPADAELLLEWRNDPATRAASHNTAEVSRDDHIDWLSASLANPARRLQIAESAGRPVGTVRADLADGVWELSWTVSPEARGRGIASRMVTAVAEQISGPIRAEVKSGNDASARIAEHAGMSFEREENGVLHFARAALD